MPVTRKLIKSPTGRRKCKQRVWRRRWVTIHSPGPPAGPAPPAGKPEKS